MILSLPCLGLPVEGCGVSTNETFNDSLDFSQKKALSWWRAGIVAWLLSFWWLSMWAFLYLALIGSVGASIPQSHSSSLVLPLERWVSQPGLLHTLSSLLLRAIVLNVVKGGPVVYVAAMTRASIDIPTGGRVVGFVDVERGCSKYGSSPHRRASSLILLLEVFFGFSGALAFVKAFILLSAFSNSFFLGSDRVH